MMVYFVLQCLSLQPFSALTLLVGWQEGHLAYKKWWDVGMLICLG